MTEPAAKAGVSYLEISAESQGQRIDNFLLRSLKGVPKSKIYRILRKGEVRVNRGRIGPDYRLQEGDRVRLPPIRVATRVSRQPPAAMLQALAASILHEDDDVLALDKPAGLPVHKGSGVDYGLIEAMRALRPDAPYLELVHRLDRDSSGCLLLAKNAAALRKLHAALTSAQVDKRYLALVRGHWDLGTKEVTAPLAKNALRGGERLVVVDQRGKSARSHFAPVNIRRRASLVEVTIATGRTHQIRVHAAHLNYPLAGDAKYGDAEFNRQMAALGLHRVFLHAHALLVDTQGIELALSAPLPDDLNGVIGALEAGR